MITALILLSTVTQVTVCECILLYISLSLALTDVYNYHYTGIQFSMQFSVTPSPNITTLQSAVFSCTVNVVVPIGWTVNKTSSADSMFWESYISSYGIVADGAGTQDTTLTIPGDPVLNGTVVQCRAVGIINNVLHNEVDSDTLYIQGM